MVRILSPGVKRAVMAGNLILMAGFGGLLAYYGGIAAQSFGARMLISVDLPMGLFRWAMPIGGALIALISLTRLAGLLTGRVHPDDLLPRKRRVMFLDPGWIILILLVTLLIAGLPIAFVLGVTAATMILLDPGVVPQIIGLIPFGGANNYLLVAALLFMIAGEVMNQGRIAEKLIAFASSLVGHIRGGLAHVNILTSLFFSEISGTATSDARRHRLGH